mmetsp:Transcript_93994/g.148586  ORF Transcript_93994/g.148586 Transcript_93994/m.148586 type:complete len:91 (-) Transcript_93994:300-572(-)
MASFGKRVVGMVPHYMRHQYPRVASIAHRNPVVPIASSFSSRLSLALADRTWRDELPLTDAYAPITQAGRVPLDYIMPDQDIEYFDLDSE